MSQQSPENDTEPDLTPMLDMVMQLLMFFIVCANFIRAQTNEDVKLPDSREAHVLDVADQESYVINLVPYNESEVTRLYRPEQMELIKGQFQENEPCILITGEFPKTPRELNVWLKQKGDDAVARSPDGKNHKVIVMRADRDLDYALVFRLLQMCKSYGFRDLKLRARTLSK